MITHLFYKNLPDLIDSFNPVIGPRRIDKVRLAEFIKKTDHPANHDAIIEAWRRLDPDDEYSVIPFLEEQKREVAIKLEAHRDVVDRLSRRWDEFDGVSIETLNWLARTGCEHIWCLVEMSEEEVLHFVKTKKNFEVIQRIVESLGLHFEMDIREFLAGLPRR